MEEIVKKLDEVLSKSEENKKSLEAKFAEEVKGINEDLAKKGATLEQIQGEVLEIKKSNGALKMASEEAKSIYQLVTKEIGENAASFAKLEKGGQFEALQMKAVAAMSSANLTGDNYISYLDHQPGMRPTGQIRFRDFARVIQSDTDFIQFPRDTGGEGSFARQSAEGAAKNQVDRDFAMQSVTLTPIAGYATVSRQSLRNIKFLQSYLPVTMLEDLLDTEDSDFAATLIAAATGDAATVGADTNYVAKLIYYIKNLIKGKHNPNAAAVDPDVWADMLLTKPSDYSLPNAVVIDPSGNVRILGRPVLPVNWCTGGRVIVGDWSKVAIVESEGLVMRQSDSHASTFTANQVTFLLERTEDLAVFRTEAFVTADLIA